MSHNSLNTGQLSVDSNANMPIKSIVVENEFKSYTPSASDDGHSETGIEKCVRCNMHAGLKCERCGDYYCSIECQTADWSRHRLICFPMPKLVKGKSMSHSIGTVNRNVSATTSPLRKRVETHDTMNSFSKMSLLDAESVIRKPLSPLANARNETKTADQPVIEMRSPLTPPRQLHVPVVVPPSIAESTIEPPAQTTMPTQSSITSPISPPKQITASKVNAEVSLTPVKPPASADELKNGGQVKLIYAGNFYSAYVRSAESDAEYFQLIQRVAVSAVSASNLTELPERSDIVNAPFLEEYYRAIVVKAESIDQPIRVAFLDFGNVAMVNFRELKVLSDDLKHAKRFAVRIFFDGVDRETVNEKGFALLKQLENEVKTTFTIQCNSNEPIIVKDSMVKLINTKTKECLNDKLASLAPPPKQESKFAKLDINCKKVVILDDGLFNCGKVACTDVKNKTAIVKNEQIIQNCGKKALQNGRFKPKLGDKCLVYVFDAEEPWWYRGECIRVNDEKALLLLLDSGKMHTAKLDDIRVFDEKCDFEPLTTIATIKNVTVQDGKVSENDQLKIRNKLEVFEQADVDQIEYIGDDDYRIKFSCI